MQRPLHARVRRKRDEESTDSPRYVPSYPMQQMPSQFASYYPTYGPTYAPKAGPELDRSRPPARARTISKRERSASNPVNGSGNKSNLPIYNGPVRYGTSRPTKEVPQHKRRNSEPFSRAKPAQDAKPLIHHVFVSLSNVHTLKIKHLPKAIPDSSIHSTILPLWWEGVRAELRTPSDWKIRFNGKPWVADGEAGFRGRRIVCRLFEILGNGGCSYVSAVNPTSFSHSPTLIFAMTPTFFASQYFCLSFSRSRRKLFIIDAPLQIVQLISAATRLAFREATEGSWITEGVYAIRMTSSSLKQQDLPPRLAKVLRAIGSQGYRLEASVPMGREGFFRMGGRREVWIFRSNVPMP